MEKYTAEGRAGQRLRRAVEEAAKGNGVVSTAVWQSGEGVQKALGTDGKWYARVLRSRCGSEYWGANREYWGDWVPAAALGLPDGVEYAGYKKIDMQVIIKRGE